MNDFIILNTKLKQALEIYQEKQLSVLPSQEELENIHRFSSAFEQKMKKLIRNQKKPYYTVTKVSITMHLEKKGFLGLYWTTVASWSQTFNSSSGSLSKPYSVSGGTYRVRADYAAYNGSASETYTEYSSEVKY